MKFTNEELFTMRDALAHAIKYCEIQYIDKYKELDIKIRKMLQERGF